MQAHLTSCPQRRAGAVGFTLVEVLVALFIMAVLSLMAWQGVDALVRTRDGARDAQERSLRLGTVLAQWEQDLNQIQQSSAAPGLKFDGQSLRLTRRTPEGMQVVLWTRQDNTWYRWASPAVTRIADLQDWWMRSLQWSAVGAEALPMLQEVQALQVYYFQMGDNNWSNAQSTGNVVNRLATPPPPAGSGPGDGGDDGGDGAGNGGGGAGGGGTGGNPPAPIGGSQELLPTGVRLVITLPQGSLTRDVLMRTSTS